MQRYILFILFISLIYPRSADWDADTVHTSLLSYKVELFSDGYVIRWGMAFLPDGDLLVSDISGKIYRVNRNGGEKAMISGVPKVFYKGQGGMLDVEVHPEFEKNKSDLEIQPISIRYPKKYPQILDSDSDLANPDDSRTLFNTGIVCLGRISTIVLVSFGKTINTRNLNASDIAKLSEDDVKQSLNNLG